MKGLKLSGFFALLSAVSSVGEVQKGHYHKTKLVPFARLQVLKR